MRKQALLLLPGSILCFLFLLSAIPVRECRVLIIEDISWDPEIGRHLEGLGAQDGTAFRIERADGISPALSARKKGSFDAIVLGRTLMEGASAAQVRRLQRRTGARLLLHQDWAYAVDYFKEPCIEPAFAAYGYDQRRMYDDLTARTQALAGRWGLEVLPVGTAVQNVRGTFDRDNLTCDGVRLNHSIGCYLAACIWYEALTGRDVRENAYDPGRLSPERAALSRGAAHAAMEHPYAVTDFGFRKHGVLSYDVEVPLVVLALAALRHALVAEALRDRRPLEREGKLLLALRNHARERGRHLGPEREVALGLVEKVVNLLADFLARFPGKEFITLDDARIVLTETRRLSRGAKRVENAAAPRHVLGIEVPHSARRLKTDLVCHRSVLS